MRYKCTGGYYSATKESEIMPFAATWMDLENIILCEVSRDEKDTYRMYDTTYMWNLKYDTSELTFKTEADSETENRVVVATRGGGIN